MTPAPQALINYVLRHVAVTANPGSRQYFDTGYTLELRTVRDYNLIHCTRGTIVWVVAGQEYRMPPGGLVIVPPHVEHHGYSTTKRMGLGSVHLEAHLPGGQDIFQLLSIPRYQHVTIGSHLDKYLRGAVDEHLRKPEGEAQSMQQGWAELIVKELIRHDARSGLLQYRAADPLVIAMLDELDRRIAEPVDLDQLAKRSGFSPQYLNRVFRRSLGVTPLQYLARARMELAASLLREGKLTVRAVANRTGFDDPYYFSRVFSQHFGRSPQQYRQAAVSENPS